MVQIDTTIRDRITPDMPKFKRPSKRQLSKMGVYTVRDAKRCIVERTAREANRLSDRARSEKAGIFSTPVPISANLDSRRNSQLDAELLMGCFLFGGR